MIRTNHPSRAKKSQPRKHEKTVFVTPVKLTREEQADRQEFLKEMAQWAMDDSGEQAKSWPIAEKMLKENALSYRNR